MKTNLFLLVLIIIVLLSACGRPNASSPAQPINTTAPLSTRTSGPEPTMSPTNAAKLTPSSVAVAIPTENAGDGTPVVTKEAPTALPTMPAPTVTTSNPLPALAADPAPAEVIVSPQVFDFQVAPATAGPNDVVTLSWNANGSQATICPSAQVDLFTQADCQDVPLSGEMAFTIPPEAAGTQHISFHLTVQAGDLAPVVAQASVQMRCHITWFFSDEPQAGVCPMDPVYSFAAAQHFEHGNMIWVEQLGRYFILEDSILYAGEARKRIGYIYDPLDIVQDTSAQVQPPEGFLAPISGFGLVWRGDITGSSGYQESLGWALAPEFGYQATFQCDDAPPSGGRSWQFCHLQGPYGEIIVLHPLGGWYLLGEQ